MDQDEFLAATLKNPVNERIARELFDLALPDSWLVSGCLVQTVWNVMTGRAAGYGISDYDVFYFDPDTSWEAEDAAIRKLGGRLSNLGVKMVPGEMAFTVTPSPAAALESETVMLFIAALAAE